MWIPTLINKNIFHNKIQSLKPYKKWIVNKCVYGQSIFVLFWGHPMTSSNSKLISNNVISESVVVVVTSVSVIFFAILLNQFDVICLLLLSLFPPFSLFDRKKCWNDYDFQVKYFVSLSVKIFITLFLSLGMIVKQLDNINKQTKQNTGLPAGVQFWRYSKLRICQISKEVIKVSYLFNIGIKIFFLVGEYHV